MKLLVFAILFLLGILLLGTIGYVIIEEWSILDSFYMTVISITTTGFAEVRPLTPAGRVWTVFLIIAGVSTIAFIGGQVVQEVVESKLFRRRKMSKNLDELSDHYIVCGFGRLGKPISSELSAMNTPFVVIERKEGKIDELIELDYRFVMGDATQDETLIKAGIKQAKGLVAVLASDAENVYATLTAKVLNPKIFVVTRAIEEEAEKKLTRAGANRIVKPYEIGALRMAHLLIRPGVADFIDLVAQKKGVDLNLEEIIVKEGSPINNKTLAESELRQRLNIIIVAIFRAGGEWIYNPTSSVKIQSGDRLIAIGEWDDLVELNKLCEKQPE